MIKRHFKRFLVYGILIAVGIAVVVYKQRVVSNKRNAVIVSTINEWKNNGKPVGISRIKLEDVKEFTKVSLNFVSGNIWEGQVPQKIWSQLKPEQKVYLEETNQPQGQILSVDEDISLETGMYHFQVTLDSPVNNNHTVALVETNVIPQQIIVDSKILSLDKGQYYLWKIVGNKAKKQLVVLGEQKAAGYLVKEGLIEGDWIVSEGQTLLNEDDNVLVIDCQDCKLKEGQL